MTRRPRVGFVVNGGPKSAMAERAAAFADRLADRFDIRLVFREGGTGNSALRMLSRLAAFRPACCYVFDLAAAGVIAAGMYKHATGTPFVLDTGDDVVALGRVLGRGPLGMLATRALEAYALRAASHVVVRGSCHRDVLRKRGIKATFIPDGVSVGQFSNVALQPSLNADKTLTIGLVGSSVWIPSRQTCYGWELVEVVRILKDRLPGFTVRGVLIGNGSGIEVLKARCERNGDADRIEFAGRVPYDDLPAWLQRFDICLSTQTDDAIGRVRTTGKLPLYLAAGRFVLASRVGEAARVLPPEMLVEFRGSVDPDYPERLASRIVELFSVAVTLRVTGPHAGRAGYTNEPIAAGPAFSPRPDCIALAREHFEYDRLAPRVAAVLEAAMEGRR